MKKSILVIDDEERIAKSLESLLEEEGYDVDIALGGPEGLEKLKEKNYHLIITDLRMPHVDGFQIMEYITQNLPNAAIIVITGHASTESAIEAIHQKVVDYITKPFEFDHLLASIEKVFAQLEAENMREDMRRMISHDIKVPLNSIIGFAQFVEDGTAGPVSPKASEFAGKISDNAQRIVSLLDNYLTQTCAESGRLEILRSKFNLKETIEESIQILQNEFDRKEIKVHLDFCSNAGLCYGDENLLFRCISNLICNAAKYTLEGGEVWIRTIHQKHSTLGAGVLFEIKNTGDGLSPEEVKKVFGKYERLSTAHGNPGAGIGLYVVNQVALAHQGIAECDSSLGGITTFTLFIPDLNDD